MRYFHCGMLVGAALFLGIPAIARADDGTKALPPLPPPADEAPPPAQPPPAQPPSAAPRPSSTASQLPAPPPPYAPPSPPAPGDAPDSEATAQSETSGPTWGPAWDWARIPKVLVVSAGLGFSFPYDFESSGAEGSGFYWSAEYALLPSPWFSPRVYAGMLVTSADETSCSGRVLPCDASAQIGFVGIKGRLTIPIPYVAPFAEAGLGMSIGAMSTQTPGIDKRLSGITYNVPFALGLSFGAGQRYFIDLALGYLVHPALSQYDAAFALSLAFPLR